VVLLTFLHELKLIINVRTAVKIIGFSFIFEVFE